MTSKTAALLNDPHPHSHIVLPYTDEDNLTDAVALYAAAGLTNDEAVLLVTTNAHRRAVEEHLKYEGFDVEALQRDGRLSTFDASGLLCEFYNGEMPDADAFMRLVGAMIETARSHSPVGKVRIYGEMVNLLCGHNSIEAAANLEDLWNNVLGLYSVPLLCSYSLQTLPANAAGVLPQRIVDAHSHTAAVI